MGKSYHGSSSVYDFVANTNKYLRVMNFTRRGFDSATVTYYGDARSSPPKPYCLDFKQMNWIRSAKYNDTVPGGCFPSKERNQRVNTFAAALALLAVPLFQSSITLAQRGARSIQGTVHDATGAALPGSAVPVVNRKTGVSNDTTANNAGFFSVQGLFAGTK